MAGRLEFRPAMIHDAVFALSTQLSVASTYLPIWAFVEVSAEAEAVLVSPLRRCSGAPRFLARHLRKLYCTVDMI